MQISRAILFFAVILSGASFLFCQGEGGFRKDSIILEKFICSMEYAREGRYNDSIAQLEAIMDIRDDLFVPYIHLFRLYKDNERSLSVTEDFLAKYPDNTQALEIYAELLTAGDRYDEAIETYKKLLEISGDEPSYYAIIGRLLFFHGEKQEARKYLLHYINGLPSAGHQDELIYYLAGNLFELEREYSLAAHYYMESIKRQPYYSYSLKSLEGLSRNHRLNNDLSSFYRKMIEMGQNRDYFVEAFISNVLGRREKECLPYLLELLSGISEDKRDAHYSRRLNYARYLSGEYDSVIKDLEGTISRTEPDNNLLMLLYNSFTQKGEFANARGLLEEFRDIFPEKDYLGLLYELLVLEDRKADALGVLKKLYDENPGSDEIFIEYGRAVFFLDSEEKALHMLKNSLENKHAGNVAIRLLYTELLMQNGKEDQALEECEKIILEDRGNRQAYMQALRIISRVREFRDKIYIAELFLENFYEPEDYLIAADFLLTTDNLQSAENLYKRALAIYPENQDILFSFSGYFFRADDIEGSIEILEGLYQARPYSPNICNSLAYSYILEGINLEKASGMLQYALKIEPLNPAFIDSMGWYYYIRGDYPRALEYIEKAWKLTGNDPEILEHLGLVYMKTGKEEKASEFFKRAADLYPSVRDSKRVEAYMGDPDKPEAE